MYQSYPVQSYTFDKSPDERRREMAIRQFQKNKELADLLSRKNYHSPQSNGDVHKENQNHL